jgi:hypothetical protein
MSNEKTLNAYTTGLIGRRTFIARLVAAGVGLATATTWAHVLAPPAAATASGAAGSSPVPARHGAVLRGMELPGLQRNREGRFGFMFKGLAPFLPPDELLLELAGTMVEPSGVPFNQDDNPRIPGGFTFLGQFIDHDLTRDTTPMPEQQDDPLATSNFRSPRYDLDSVYGPAVDAYYHPDDPAKLLVTGAGSAEAPHDIPRASDGTGILGDPRNDENLLVCQHALAIMRFHNAVVDHLRDELVPAAGLFEEARRLTRWHYQWLVVHDFLPRVVGEETMAKVFEERSGRPPKVTLRYYRPGNANRPMMPLEFSVAAYRFGHSMVRPAYRVAGSTVAKVFGTASDTNLNGSRPIPPNLVVHWPNFYEFDGEKAPQRTRLINSDLSLPLFNLPASVVPPPDPLVSLAARNLIRGKRLGLASGQQVAQAMGVEPLSNAELGLDGAGWEGQAPLWFYVLKEAELHHAGHHLGAVGGAIVAEVLVGLLQRDPTSYLRQDPSFRPAPPLATAGGRFVMQDLLRFASRARPVVPSASMS